MAEHPKLTVTFEIEARGEDLYFRATHKPVPSWHGPYQDLLEVSATIAHYLYEDALDAVGAELHASAIEVDD